MNAENNNKRTKVAIIGSAGAGRTCLARTLLERLDKEGAIELIEIDETNVPERGIEITKMIVDDLKLTPTERYDEPYFDKQKKPYQDRNVRRHSRKSKW